jgi:hypothetical protein
MDQSKIIEALEKLAIKLGVTAEHLWEVLLKQAPIEAIICSIEIVACFLLLVLWIKIVFVKTKKYPRESYLEAEWEEEAAFFAITSLVVWTVFTVIFSIYNIKIIATCLLNPEYWALMKVIRP